MASSQIMVMKIGRSTFKKHNFCIQTLIKVILVSLEMSLCVEYERNVLHYINNFLPKKYLLMPQNSPTRF